MSASNLVAKYLPEMDSLVVTIENEKEDSYEVLAAYYELILELYRLGEKEDAEIYKARFEAFSKTHFPEIGKGCSLLLQSRSQFINGNDVSKSIGLCLDGIGILELANDTNVVVQDILALSYDDLGYLFEKNGAYDKALSYYLKAIEIARKNDLQSIILITYADLSYLLGARFNDEKTSFTLMQAALQIAIDNKDQENIGIMNSNMAEYYIRQNAYESARVYVERAIETQTKLGDHNGLAHSYFSFATIQRELGEIESAKASLKQSLQLTQVPCDWCYQISGMFGAIAKDEGKYDLANQYFQTAFEEAKLAGNIAGVNKSTLDLAKLNEEQGRNVEATRYFARYVAQKDSLDKLWKLAEVGKLQMKYKVENIVKEKESLKIAKEKSEAQLENQQLATILIALILFGTVTGGYFLWKSRRKINRFNKILVKKNRQLITRATESSQPAKASTSVNIKESETQAIEFNSVEVELIEKIRTELEVNEVFADPELTLASLAQKLETNTSYLSNVINNAFGKNFRSLINEHRVAKVLAAFENDEHKTLTIFAIAQKAGFKSKSAFNNAFNDFTGVTPTIYIKNM